MTLWLLQVALPLLGGGALLTYAALNNIRACAAKPGFPALSWAHLHPHVMLYVQVGLPLLGGGALLMYAALNYHTTLKFVGVLGVMLTVANKLLSYDSPKDAFDDITGRF
jgi:hypothetical protein